MKHFFFFFMIIQAKHLRNLLDVSVVYQDIAHNNNTQLKPQMLLEHHNYHVGTPMMWKICAEF